MSALAARATTQPSMTRCLDSLDAHEVFVLATVARICREHPATRPAILDELAVGLPADQPTTVAATVADAVEKLRLLGLLWGTPNSLRAVTAVHELVHDTPPEAPGPPPSPSVTATPWDPTGSRTDAAAAQGAREFVAIVDELLDRWGRQPPQALRRGGIAVRDVLRTCEDLAVVLPTAILAMEVARGAGLLDHDESGLWLPTPGYDAWTTQGIPERLLALARAWLALPFCPSSRDERTCLTDPAGGRVLVVPTRRATLRVMAEAPCGLGASMASVIAVLDYRHPRRSGAARDRVVAATMTEGRVLGLVVEDAVATFARALINDQIAEATDALRSCLPAIVDSIVVQADLTVTVTGLLDPVDERVLRTCTDVESRSPALVARLSAGSIDRGAGAGCAPQTLRATLTRLSRSPLPQAVEYLLTDAERRGPSITVSPPGRSSRTPPPPVTIRTTNLGSRARTIARALLADEVPVGRLDLPSPPTTRVSGGAALSVLREAMHDGRSAWIEVAESDGQLTLTLVDPIRVSSGTLTAFDHQQEQLRHFSLARIRTVAVSPTG
jgi:hypothetical protein